MAWFKYKCPTHDAFSVSLAKREREVSCPKCQQLSKPIIGVGSTQIVERLDNGAMARAVERLHNIEEIMNDRADQHTEQDALIQDDDITGEEGDI